MDLEDELTELLGKHDLHTGNPRNEARYLIRCLDAYRESTQELVARLNDNSSNQSSMGSTTP
jgi:hypothetical protein